MLQEARLPQQLALPAAARGGSSQPNSVKFLPLEPSPPRGGPVPDPVLTPRSSHYRQARGGGVQGYLAHRKTPSPGTLRHAYAWSHVVVLRGGRFLMSEVLVHSASIPDQLSESA